MGERVRGDKDRTVPAKSLILKEPRLDDGFLLFFCQERLLCVAKKALATPGKGPWPFCFSFSTVITAESLGGGLGEEALEIGFADAVGPLPQSDGLELLGLDVLQHRQGVDLKVFGHLLRGEELFDHRFFCFCLALFNFNQFS